MTQEPSQIEQPPPDEQEPQNKALVLFRFVLVPLILVGVVVVIILLFGSVALEEKSVKDYLYDIKTGSKSERWQAAYHLSNLMANPKKDYAEQARKSLPEMIQIFEKAKNTDPEIRRYLALAFGRLQDPRAVPTLQQSLHDDDSQTVIWSIWSLGAIGDKSAAPAIRESMENTDPGIRAISAYVLGALQDSASIPALQGHLEDASNEVKWNAAIALARMNDASGADILLQLLDRNYLSKFPQANPDELLINAMTAGFKLNHPEIRERILQISQSDSSPRVRDTAIKLLQ